MAQSRIPRITTRGYYDLRSGASIRRAAYGVYPAKFFANLGAHNEFTIMVHGMRNDISGALAKFEIAQGRLRRLGYAHPVVGFSYDSNVAGAHIKSSEARAVRIARAIAKRNGWHLARFILDCKGKSPETRIRLMGHSLGSEVILHALSYLVKRPNVIEGVYFFGSSISSCDIGSKKWRKVIRTTVKNRVLNYYSKNDDVLKDASERGLLKEPIGYCGLGGKMPKCAQKMVRPKNHRFASYAATLSRYP